MDSSSEMTLRHEELSTKLEIFWREAEFYIDWNDGITESRESSCRHSGRIYGWIDFSCARKYQAVRNIPISEGWIPRKDLKN